MSELRKHCPFWLKITSSAHRPVSTQFRSPFHKSAGLRVLVRRRLIAVTSPPAPQWCKFSQFNLMITSFLNIWLPLWNRSSRSGFKISLQIWIVGMSLFLIIGQLYFLSDLVIVKLDWLSNSRILGLILHDLRVYMVITFHSSYWFSGTAPLTALCWENWWTLCCYRRCFGLR